MGIMLDSKGLYSIYPPIPIDSGADPPPTTRGASATSKALGTRRGRDRTFDPYSLATGYFSTQHRSIMSQLMLTTYLSLHLSISYTYIYRLIWSYMYVFCSTYLFIGWYYSSSMSAPCQPPLDHLDPIRTLKGGAKGFSAWHSVRFSRPAERSRRRISSKSPVSAASCACCSEAAQAAASWHGGGGGGRVGMGGISREGGELFLL